MARVIRNCWVYKPLHQYKMLPRPNFGVKQYDYEAAEATPEHFPKRLATAPKLWMAWIYKPDLSGEPRWIRQDVELLFGEDWKPGRPEVFKNTASWNRVLWRVKHLLEVRPVTFVDGEPSEAELASVRLLGSGECVKRPPDQQLTDFSPLDLTLGQLLSHTTRRWHQCRPINEDDVWSDPNISKI